MDSKENNRAVSDRQLRKVTVALHTREHADKLRRLLQHEGVYADLVAARLGQKFTEHPIEVRIPEDDLPAALRIIENIEIFPLYNDVPADGSGDAAAGNKTAERALPNVTKRVGLRKKVVVNSRPSGKTI
ncbi:MAG: hypothetical protein K2L69_04460, partial [Muribaculaceae bacterium]|nr:hypothetical protein [Muribaculaceae bacterium]